MKIYIASPFFKQEQKLTVNLIVEGLKKHKIKYYSPKDDGILINMSVEERQKAAGDIFQKNIDEIDKCDTMIAVTDDFDPGTMFELGMAYAKNSFIITYSPSGYGANVMIAKATMAHYINMNDMIKNLVSHINDEDMKSDPIEVTE